MVGCTDFSEDIQAVDKKVDDLTSSTQTELTNLKSAVAALEAKLDAQYATKEEVAALKSTLEDTIAEEVAALNGDIAKVNAALQTAQEQISAAIADLDDKKADKTAVDAAIKTATEAIEKLNSDLQAAKGELEAEIADVKAQIAATQTALEEQIAAVDAKAMENYNTLVALSEYLEGLEAKVNEINNTLLSLSEYLPEMKAELEGKIADVDAKAMENYYTLVALSEHLEEYEATTDMKLVELQGSLAALSAYLEEYEASVDAKFKEILGTFESLSLFLDEKFAGIEDKLAALDETDTDLYKEIDGLRKALTAVNNLLEDEVKARQAADEELYKKISEETQAKVEELQQAISAVNFLLEDEVAARKAADDAIWEEIDNVYVEINNLNTYLGQVYNALSLDIATVDAALKAHIAAFEAYKAEIAVAIRNLQLNDDSISERLAMHTDKLAKTIDAKVAELQAQDEELWTKINNVEEYLSQAIALLETEMQEADAAMYKELTEEIESVQRGLQESLTNVNNLVSDLMEDFNALVLRVTANEEAIESIEDAIEQLTEWLKTNDANDDAISQVVNTLVDDLDKAIADIKDLQEETGDIYDLIGKTTTNLTNLIADANQTIQGLKDLCSDQQNQIGANQSAIYALQVLVNNINKNFGDRLEALENQVGANTEAIQKLVERVQSLVYVPDYSDHKATIEWARVVSSDVMTADLDEEKTPVYVNIVKKSDLKYLVKANAGENAATAAAEIEAAWKDVLDYNVTDVKTRGAAESGADLEIVNVKADGEYIIVSVVAKNFDAKFFEHKRQGIYSAALVLGDKNGNNMTSEYTNLVPGKAAEVKAVILAGDKKTDITNTVVDETLYLQYDLEETVIPLDGHAVYFQEGEKTYSVEDFQKAGYDFKVDSKAISTLTENWSNTYVPAFTDMWGSVKMGPFQCENPEAKYWVVSLKETLAREAFLKINGTDEQDLEIKYIYTVNGVEIFAAQNVEISKKIVNVNLPVITVPWTVAEAESLMAGGVTYSVDLVKEQTYDIATAADKSLEGYTLASVMNRTAADKKVYINGEAVETADIKIQVKDRQETTYKMILGNRFDGNAKSYSFPVNNNDEKVDWNVYKATWTYELEDMKVFVTGTMELGEQAPVQNVPVPVDFKVMKGVNGWLTGSADVLTAAYEQFKSYLGYADEATDKAKFLALFVGENNAVRYRETTVNEKAVDYMKNTPYTGFEPQNFKLHSSSLTAPVDGKYPVQVIQQVVKPWFGIDFNFIVNGNVVLPKDVLNYSTVDFVSFDAEQNRWEVEVDGDIVADQTVEHGRKYTIDQADLGKYFFVSDEAEYGVDRMLTVKFEVLTENAPLPETTDVVNVFEDATSQINVLEEGKSVIKDWTNGGNFVGNEIKVKATLLANGFAIDDKEVTLFTIDPLTFSKVPEVDVEGVDIQVERVPGKDAVVKSYRALSLTSVAEEGNLINTGAKTGAGLFFNSHADEVYGAEFIMHPEDQPTWTSQILGVYTKDGDEKVAYPGTKYDFTNGTLTLKADDGLLKQSIFAEVEYKLTHNYNYGKDETVTVVIEFVPNNEY